MHETFVLPLALQVFLASLADSITCQALFSSSSTRLLADLLRTWCATSSMARAEERRAARSIASMRVRASSGSSAFGEGGQVALVNVSADGSGCATFGELFSLLLTRRHMLCLALYRQVSGGQGAGQGRACAGGWGAAAVLQRLALWAPLCSWYLAHHCCSCQGARALCGHAGPAACCKHTSHIHTAIIVHTPMVHIQHAVLPCYIRCCPASPRHTAKAAPSTT
jgi:hypothetical protein